MCTLLAAVTVGCGTDADPPSSNRGSTSDTSATTVDNAYIVPTFVPGSCAPQTGSDARLRFTVTNNRPGRTERLLSVRSDVTNRIDLPPSVTSEIPARGSLAVGQPTAGTGSVTIPALTLTAPKHDFQPGTSTSFTFSFSEFGEITLQVPVEACPNR
jgi:copper(I)-binding protein